MNENLNNIFAEEQDMTVSGAGDGMVINIVNSASEGNGHYDVLPEHTLREVLNECGAKLGLSSATSQLVYEFEGKTTSDPNMTLAELGVTDGGKLLIHPNGKVA